MGVVKLSTAGIVNYEKYSNLLAGNAAFLPGSFDLLETQVLASSAASVTFSSLDTLAAGYQHLQIRAVGRSDGADSGSVMTIQFNGDTGANYSRHALLSINNSVTSTGASSQTSIWAARFSAANSTASSFGAVVCDILDFANTSKYTTIRGLSGITSEPIIQLASGAWLNTAAVDSITLDQVIGTNFVTGSRFSIYGLRTGA